jgi:hypothetical protein
MEHCSDYADRRLEQVLSSSEHLKDIQGPLRIIGFANNLPDGLLGGQWDRDGGGVGGRVRHCSLSLAFKARRTPYDPILSTDQNEIKSSQSELPAG